MQLGNLGAVVAIQTAAIAAFDLLPSDPVTERALAGTEVVDDLGPSSSTIATATASNSSENDRRVLGVGFLSIVDVIYSSKEVTR